MRTVEIEVFQIARTQVSQYEVGRWLRWLEVSGESANTYVSEAVDNSPALLIALAAKRCYNSFEVGHNPNITKVRKDLTEYLDNVLRSGHGSVLEHSTYTFAVEGCSRVFTGEMNRHRAGVAISEASMRYIRYDDIPFWMPTSLLPFGEDRPELIDKKRASRQLLKDAFADAESYYKELLRIWKDELAPESKFHLKKQITSMMRRIIPMGVATGGVWTLNIRALRHVIAMRASEAAEEEICYVAGKMAEIMLKDEPDLFGDFQRAMGKYYEPKYKKV